MIAVDTNVLVYAHRREAREHDVARRLLAELANGDRPWAIPWPCVFEFFGVVTHRKLWGTAASSQAQALAQIEAWSSAPAVRLLAEPDDFLVIVTPLLQRSRVLGPVVHDARVAAICLCHGVERLLTRDRDFSLFPELATQNPFRA